MPGGRSTLPDVQEYLYGMFSQITLNGSVRYGSDLGPADEQEVINVGWVDPTDDNAAEGTNTRQGMAGALREAYVLHNAIGVLKGDEGAKPAVDRAFDLLGQCGDRLAADARLAGQDPAGRGLVDSAYISSWSQKEDQTTGGVYIRLTFAIAIEAWQRST
jgi:hypothetical protein